MARGEQSDSISMRRSEAIKEHKRLVKVLSTGEGIPSELRKQRRELARYRAGRS